MGTHHAALVRLRADSKKEDFQQLYRGRAPAIEGVFAEAKQRHGLRRAWRRGLTKMRIQCLLIAAALNFKRLITLFLLFVHTSYALYMAFRQFLVTVPELGRQISLFGHLLRKMCSQGEIKAFQQSPSCGVHLPGG